MVDVTERDHTAGVKRPPPFHRRRVDRASICPSCSTARPRRLAAGRDSRRMSGCQSRTTLDVEPWRDPYLRVHAVNVYVRDQERSLQFYLNTLGFRIAFDARVGSGERLLAVSPPDGTRRAHAHPGRTRLSTRPARRPGDSGRVRDRGPPRHLHRVAAAGRSLPEHPASSTCRLRAHRGWSRFGSGSRRRRGGSVGMGRGLRAVRGRRSEFVRARQLR